MRNNKINYVIVGTFVLSMLAGLVVSLALLTGRTGAADNYYTVLNNVTGIKYGTQILYEGYIVGQVEEVTPFEKNGRVLFRVDLGVQEGWKIPEDSVATVAASGLLAAVSINIAAGESPTSLKPGALIMSNEPTNIFAMVSSVANNVNDLTETTIKPLLENLNRAVGGFNKLLEGEAQSMIHDLNLVAADLKTKVPAVTDNLAAFSEDVRSSGADARKMMANVDKAAANFASISGGLTATQERLDKLLDGVNGLVTDNRPEVDKAVADMRYILETTARHIDAVNQNMEGTARNMYEFSRQIRQNPGLLLGGTPPRDNATK